MLLILGLCVFFTGSNTFLDNLASYYGGSLYIFESVVTLKGTNSFINNTSTQDIFDSLEDDWDRGSGGAIYCKSSTLIIGSDYSIFANNYADNYGGAITAVQQGNITIQGSISFVENDTIDGGAISLSVMTLILNGNISFVNNKVHNLVEHCTYLDHILSKFEEWASIKSVYYAATNFCLNVGTSRESFGNHSHNNNSHFMGIVAINEHIAANGTLSNNRMAQFCENSAYKGGAIEAEYSEIIGSAYFEKNRAVDGGAV